MSRICFSRTVYLLLIVAACCAAPMLQSANAQTDINITGATAGFPVAVPQLCNSGNAQDPAVRIPEIISKNLQISGLFKVLNPGTFVETPGKCSGQTVAYTDWSVIGAEGVVRGDISFDGNRLTAQLYLHDVQQQRVVLGKRYVADVKDFPQIAHRFSNEILFYFTGERGIFGTRIAYVSRVGRFKELFVMDLDGSNVRQLTRDNGLAMSPSWSRDGSKLVYTSYLTRQPELYTISPEGGKGLRITKRPGLEMGAEFAPDNGSMAVSASFNGVSKIATFDLSGRMIKKLTDGSAIDVSPSWSPDGSQMAFCSNRGGGPQIYIMPSSGGAARRISYSGSNYCTSPAWSPKGDKIVYVCMQGGIFQLFTTTPDGGSGTQITFSGSNEDPSWSPDGRFIAFSSTFGGRTKSIAVLSLLGGSPTQISVTKSEDSQPTWSPMPNMQ